VVLGNIVDHGKMGWLIGRFEQGGLLPVTPAEASKNNQASGWQKKSGTILP
jgi:hypothetical protein